MISKNNNGSFSALLSRMVRDESGAEVIEAALIIGLIAVLCIGAISTFGGGIVQRWNALVNLL